MIKKTKIVLLTMLSMLFVCNQLQAREYADSAIYQGMHVKLDLGNTAYTMLRTKAKTQQYEVLVSANLLKRFYPTLEGGFGWSDNQAGSGAFRGQGGFFRAGMDLNPLKKNRNNDYALLVGVRVGCGMQNYSLSGVSLNDNYWNPEGTFRDYPKQFRADAWGEIVAAAQVKVAGPFFMGWAGRIHFLFTEKSGDHQPYWIPGYGIVAGGFFSFNYYVGLRF